MLILKNEKIMKKLIFILFCLLTSYSWALDKKDEGTYQVINTNGTPLNVYMRYYQKDSQWFMDGKLRDGGWQHICNAEDDCKLIDSSTEDMNQWKTLLPIAMQTKKFSCINNIAFAFCHTDGKSRQYWWIPLTNKSIEIAFSAKRINQ